MTKLTKIFWEQIGNNEGTNGTERKKTEQNSHGKGEKKGTERNSFFRKSSQFPFDARKVVTLSF